MNDTSPSKPIEGIYQSYLDCLNVQDWSKLSRYVDANVQHNGRSLGLSGYRDMLIENFENIPDLRFQIDFLVGDDTRIAARLAFVCSPKGVFLGLNVNGRKLSFSEHAFYDFKNSKIISVWSVIDKSAIEAQLPKQT